MSDQVFDDPESQDSHAADIDAGYDDANDDNDENDVAVRPADVPGSGLDDDEPDTSHEADIAAGYDDES